MWRRALDRDYVPIPMPDPYNRPSPHACAYDLPSESRFSYGITHALGESRKCGMSYTAEYITKGATIITVNFSLIYYNLVVQDREAAMRQIDETLDGNRTCGHGTMTVPAKQTEKLPSRLEYLHQNPDDDLDAFMPKSVQLQIKAKEPGVSRQDVVDFALIYYGVVPETLDHRKPKLYHCRSRCRTRAIYRPQPTEIRGVFLS
jgi:hypothetical protein